MSREIGVKLDDDEISEFLKDRGLGVLGLVRDGEAYTLPVAFAYDDDADRCLFRFLMTEDSLKRTFVSATEKASLTAYEWRSKDDWRSVVVRGPLCEVGADELARAAALFSDLGDESALEIFNDPISEYETVWCELRVDEVTGRGQFP